MSEPLVQLLELELCGPNPNTFGSPLTWRIRLAAHDDLPDPISVSFLWVGSAASSAFDQVLDDFDVGPLARGTTECCLECDGPQMSLVPPSDLLGVTILVISFQYHQQEFLRVGYYTQVACLEEEMQQHVEGGLHWQTTEEMMAYDGKIGRFIAMPQPAVTVTPIQWR